MGDSTFFGYSIKRGYRNARKPTQSANIYSYIQKLNLQNSTVTQVMARIWHNSRPQKVGTLIWLTLKQGLPVGTWLQCMGILPTCKVCTEEAPESPQHRLLECPLAKRAWEAFCYVWQKWGAPNDVTLSQSFIMLDEAIFEREHDTPGSKDTMQGASPTSNNHLTSFVASTCTSFGRRDAGSISITSIPLGKSFSKPGWLPLRLGWPLGRPSTSFDPPGNLVFRIGLIRPLGQNGVT